MNDSSLTACDARYVWHPFTPLTGGEPPIAIKSSEGAYITAEDGTRYLDAISSWWVTLHGHRNKEIIAALQAQLAQSEHTIFAGFTHAPGVELAQLLCEKIVKAPGRVFYSDDGSTAVEVALKLAYQYSTTLGKKRPVFVALEGGYHGDTVGAMSVGGHFNAQFSPLLFEIERIPPPQPGKEDAACKALERICARRDVAGIIYEPLIQGAGGMQMYSAQALEKLLLTARELGLVLIADEVMTGFSRTCKLLASDHVATKPDLISLSKGITGGFLPLGATWVSSAIAETFSRGLTFLHGHSYTANSLACAAAVASTKLLLEPTVQNKVRDIALWAREVSEDLRGVPNIYNPRCCGTICACEIGSATSSYTDDLRQTLYSGALARGVLLRPLGNTLYILPPYCITEHEYLGVGSVIKELSEEVQR